MAKPSEHQEVKTPKVFISYAQSDERTLRIPEICERLTHDGVEVVADLYELPHGADIHAFMERCVNRALFPIRPTLYKKPALGAPPAYATAPQEPSRPSASKFLSWRQVGARHAIR